PPILLVRRDLRDRRQPRNPCAPRRILIDIPRRAPAAESIPLKSVGWEDARPRERWDAKRAQRRSMIVEMTRAAPVAATVALVLLTAGAVSHRVGAATQVAPRVVC